MVYDISCKTLYGSKPLCIKFDEIDGFIRVYDEVRYLVLFFMKNMMAFTIGLDIVLVKKGALPLEKTLAFCNVIIFIKSVLNKDKSHYYSIIF